MNFDIIMRMVNHGDLNLPSQNSQMEISSLLYGLDCKSFGVDHLLRFRWQNRTVLFFNKISQLFVYIFQLFVYIFSCLFTFSSWLFTFSSYLFSILSCLFPFFSCLFTFVDKRSSLRSLKLSEMIDFLGKIIPWIDGK